MYLFFDTETTGLPENFNAPAGAAWPRLVSISWQLRANENVVIEKGHYIIKPKGFKIPQEAICIHGITNEMALKEGQPLEYVLGKFSKACIQAHILIAHNIEFDVKVVESAYLQTNLAFNCIGNKSHYCTKEASRDLLKISSPKGGFKALRLGELYRYFFNEDFQGAHNSECDTEACANCFFKMQSIKSEKQSIKPEIITRKGRKHLKQQ